jgi:hypothetical protein
MIDCWQLYSEKMTFSLKINLCYKAISYYVYLKREKTEGQEKI